MLAFNFLAISAFCLCSLINNANIKANINPINVREI